MGTPIVIELMYSTGTDGGSGENGAETTWAVALTATWSLKISGRMSGVDV